MRRRPLRSPVTPFAKRSGYRLSVLVCTLPSRLDLLPQIVKELNRQANGLPVELLYLGDNKAMTVGAKRNLLLSMASGDYVCFVDDDDSVADNYIAKILEGIGACDVFSFNCLKTENGTRTIMDHNVKHGKNFSEKGVIKMLPNHINAIRREIAQSESFPDRNLREDHMWAEYIMPKLKVQNKTDDILYFYNFNKALSETRN